MTDLTTLLNDLVVENDKVTEGIKYIQKFVTDKKEKDRKEIENNIRIQQNRIDSAERNTAAAREKVRVPEDYKTLKEAVERVHKDASLTTIIVGKGAGEHRIDGDYLEILSAMNIVGDPGVPRADIVILGGILFKYGIQGNCHLQHLTLHQAKGNGVWGQSSFTMEDVLVEECGYSGVRADSTGGVGRCTNVEVRQCGASGVKAQNGASITLMGKKTSVHHNCTKGGNNEYGLKVYGASSTIQLVFPLTKVIVSFNNNEDRKDRKWDWGAEQGGDINQIKTIGAPQSGETKNNQDNVNNVTQPLRF